jgi:hypothetical protein
VVPTQSLTGPSERRDVTLKTGAPVHNGTPNMTEEPTIRDQKAHPIGTKQIIQSTDTQTDTLPAPVRSSNLDAHPASARHAHAVAFSKTAAPYGPGIQTLEARTKPMSGAGWKH